MKKRMLAVLLILHALVWAGLMSLVARIVPDAHAAARIEPLMIGGWFVIHMLITAFAGGLRGARSEWRCLRDRLWQRPTG